MQMVLHYVDKLRPKPLELQRYILLLKSIQHWPIDENFSVKKVNLDKNKVLLTRPDKIP